MRLSARTRDTLLLIFAVTSGAWAWTIQLWLSWTLAEPACFLADGEIRLMGLDGAALWLLIGLATGAVSLAGLFASYRMWRGAGGRSLAEDHCINDPRRFFVYLGLVLNALFLLTIIMGMTSPLFLAPCA